MGHEVEIFGRPLHATSEQLVERYRRSSLDEYLAHERRHSVGNYVLVDAAYGRTRLVSSPGYCGGYISQSTRGVCVATLLQTALQYNPADIRFNEPVLAYFLTYLPASTFNSLPLATVFSGVTRLCAGSVTEVGVGKFTSRTYLVVDSMERPRSFDEAIFEVIEHMSRHGEPLAIMFSGGADSLAIYLAAAAILGPGSIRPITVQTSRLESLTNGHHRAIPVADQLGIDVDVVAYDWEHSASVMAEIEREMALEIVNSRRPDLALVGNPDVPRILLHGQNMDSLVGNNMASLDGNMERGLLSAAQLDLGADEQRMLAQLKGLAKNLQFTHEYLDDPSFQRSTAEFFRSMTTLGDVDPEAGTQEAIMRGMIATQRPNILHRPRPPFAEFDQMALMSREAEDLTSFFSQRVSGVAMMDLARFYSYGQLAAKRGCSLSLPGGVETSFLPNSGPLISYFLGRPRNLSNALSPKAEIFSFIERHTGRPYSAIRAGADGGSAARIREIDERQSAEKADSLVERNRSRIDPGASQVLARIETPRTADLVRATYSSAIAGSKPDSESFSVFNQSMCRHLLNLELLLEPP